MNDLQRRAITKMYASLRKSLDPEPLLAELLSAELVTFDQFEDISSTSLAKAADKNSRILQLVMNHGSSEAFRIFCECIEKADSAQKFLADNLRATYDSLQQEPPVSSTVPSQETEGAGQSPQCEEGSDLGKLNTKPSQLHLMHYVSKKLTTDKLLTEYCLFIGLDSFDFDAAFSDNPRDIGGAALAALNIWHKGKGKPRVWTTLIDAFVQVGMADYASELKETVRSGRLI